MAGTATEEPQTDKVPIIYAAMLQVQEKVGVIAKDKQNPYHKYFYRGIDQLYTAMHPLFVEAGLIVSQAVINSSDTQLESGFRVKQRIRYTFFAKDGSTFVTEAEGEGADSHDRATSKSNTDAYKSAIFKTFSIPVEDPTDTGDPESGTPDVKAATFGKKAEDAKPTPKAEPKAATKPSPKETTTDNPGGTKRATFVPTVTVLKEGEGKRGAWKLRKVTSPSGNEMTTIDGGIGELIDAAAKEKKELGFIFKQDGEYRGKPKWAILAVFDPKSGETL